MASYLLLRDNKQNGPYTFEEIKAKGLKAYDLVWVEGKSAAWRYPGEVEELKPFSPAVVEQPYDRFFKKPSQENKTAEPAKQIRVPEKEIINSSFPQASLQVGKRSIYVTLPTPKNNNTKEIFVEKEAAKKEPSVVINQEINSREYVRPAVTQAAIIAEQKESFIQQPQQQKTATKNIINKIIPSTNFALPDGFKNIFLLAAVVVVLISGGIFIGLSINKNSSVQLAKNNNNITDQQAMNSSANTIPVSTSITDQKQNDISTDNSKNSQATDLPVEKKQELVIEKKKIAAPKEKTEIVQNAVAATTPNNDSVKNSSSIIPTTHREATHRTDAVPDKDALKNTLVNQVLLSANKYNVGTFGGISDLQITVSNHSVHQLDLVIVQVEYLQANKKIFKTENIYYHNINAGEAIMLEAPKSPRGIKVQSKITVINTKDASLSYSAL